MFKFYLRQTIPFKFSDIIEFIILFSSKYNYTAKLIEDEICQKIGTKYSVVTSSMRIGLVKSLEYFSKKYPKKNEIILPEYSFHSNLSSVLNLGLKTKFAPVDLKTLEIDLEKLPKLINKKTLGIIVTHIHGLSYPMEKLVPILKKNRILLFEDCAHVFGENYKTKKLGSFGIGYFSFGSGKNVTSFGGGAICTNNSDLYSFLKKQQKTEKNLLHEAKTFLLAIVYTLISNPFFSFLIMKPLLGISYIINYKKIDKNKFIIDKEIPIYINTPNYFQMGLLYYQLEKIYNRIQNIIDKRKKIACFYDIFFKNKNLNQKHNFYFQYPIYTDNKDLLIKKSWWHNLDIQTDYCSYLPDLYQSNKLGSKFDKQIVYLPVNYHISIPDLEKKLLKIFKNEN